jgi:hypothetical protein
MSKLTSPLRRPQEFGFKLGDSHLVVNATTKTCKAFAFGGALRWERPCLADGQHPNWRANSGDTPPGLYKLGATYNDYSRAIAEYGQGIPPMNRDRRSYGWCSFDMVDLEGNEDDAGRAGIMAHGGGSVLGWPGAWLPYQQLVPTLGCLRMHNQDLLDLVLPLVLQGTVFVSVHQDDR